MTTRVGIWFQAYSSADIDFSRTLPNFILRNSVSLQEPVSQWALLDKNHTQNSGFGGFVGLNCQWDDIIFGIEANYSFFNNLSRSSVRSITFSISNPPGFNPLATYTLTLQTNRYLKSFLADRGGPGL